MRAVGPTWGFLLVGTLFLAAGLFCIVRPETAWRMRKGANEELRKPAATRRTLIYVRTIGAVLAVLGSYLFVAALVR